MMNKSIKKEFLKFFFGVAKEREKQVVFESEESDKMLQKTWDNFEVPDNERGTFDKQRVFNSIQARISNSKNNPIRSIFIESRKYAAIFLLGVLVTFAAILVGVFKPFSNSNSAIVELNNIKGDKVFLTLPDGSKVSLNAKSRITYPKKFDKLNRLVTLEGEAFFEVVKDSTKPFIINTSFISIEVLGTSFNLMAYSDESTIETTLVTGKVKINRENPLTKKVQSVILSPNHKAIFVKESETFLMDKVDVSVPISWKDGVIVFDNELFETVVKRLGRKYDVNIELCDEKLKKYRYTFNVRNESLEQVLEIIKKTSAVRYSKVNGKIINSSDK